ncbi:MAG: fructosamine kinase family protein [Meiothermus sp.]|uniref:fructosamine kinase family protein n=1 Tax=Meiothermus sp. TaxID=1955249 RepID=UPI0025D47E03|nr:fructosamine kinase family protein [Meiothermus sp.]MCS7058751.1 fructosamine kinase family protein [Meiothermus sp.]MCS7195370.1 fructosamine kinase family protein [Meiothermus sp.]MCX7740127.1 fructosamine kinase family protein [Meiothermus sp.]MDW8091029.1 fructosamine kinase family protein [Meiothermus sp.]MDW8482226.1 fructosamine kinase family protein [Meiothermus sp.]
MHPAEILRRAQLPQHPAQPLPGGDTGQVWRAGPYVVKTHPDPPAGLFPTEARGLQALQGAGVRTPRVFWVGEEGLVLEYLPQGRPCWPALAEMLARLHRHKAPTYGSPAPVYLGRFALPEGTSDSWARFWVDKRIKPLLEATWKKLGNLAARVEAALEAPLPQEGPVLIHGDLWHGNVLHARGGPVLLDPSAWWGERGVDLAMMRLFGGFPQEFWRHYQAHYPIPPEVEAALPRYQLYYLLLHLHFFGPSYLPAIARIA